jgi:hypothetical protein
MRVYEYERAKNESLRRIHDAIQKDLAQQNQVSYGAYPWRERHPVYDSQSRREETVAAPRRMHRLRRILQVWKIPLLA